MRRFLFWAVMAVVATGWLWSCLSGVAMTVDLLHTSKVWFAMMVFTVPLALVALVTEKRFWAVATVTPTIVGVVFDGGVYFSTLFEWMRTALPGGVIACVGLCILPMLETHRGS